jgi:hypothetical protein
MRDNIELAGGSVSISNRDHLVDGLHSILELLWEGSDQAAASEFRKLMVWRAKAVKPFVPTYRAGTFPAPVFQEAQDLDFLESATAGMSHIEAALNGGDASVTVQRVKDLLSALSEPQYA